MKKGSEIYVGDSETLLYWFWLKASSFAFISLLERATKGDSRCVLLLFSDGTESIFCHHLIMIISTGDGMDGRHSHWHFRTTLTSYGFLKISVVIEHKNNTSSWIWRIIVINLWVWNNFNLFHWFSSPTVK